MAFIVLVGCDGSGKSSVIEGLIKLWNEEGITVETGHWCPSSESSSDTNEKHENADDPHAVKPRGLFSSVAKLGWISYKWWSSWIKKYNKASKNGMVVFDRFYGDLLVDPTRYRYGGPMWIARIWAKCLPQPDLLLFLDADEEVLMSRKQEVSMEALRNSRNGYTKLVNTHANGQVVNTEKELAEVISDVALLVSSKKLLNTKHS